MIPVLKQMPIRYPYLQAQITAMDESVPVLHAENTALGGYGSTVALLSSRIESAGNFIYTAGKRYGFCGRINRNVRRYPIWRK